MVAETILVNTDGIRIAEIESTDGDNYVLRIKSERNGTIYIGDEEIPLKANITTAFAAAKGRRLAAILKTPVADTEEETDIVA